MSSPFTPQTLLSFITYFENSVTSSNLFYYESTTNTINFGYGINLTSAENAALGGNSTTKDDLNSWLSQNGITLTATQWQSFATGTLTSTNGPGVASNLSTSYSSLNAPNVALSVTNSFVNGIVTPGVAANVTNLTSLPITTQWALESMYYNGPGTLGPTSYGDAGAGNLAGLAEQLAFNSSAAVSGSSGLEERYLGAALWALGIEPTFEGTESNQITGASFTSAEPPPNQAQVIAQFLYDTLNPGNTLGHTTSSGGSQSAQSYISAWSSSNVTASYNYIISQMEAFLVPLGYYVVQSGDTSTNIISKLTALGASVSGMTATDLLRVNAPFGVTGISTGTLLHVPVSSWTGGVSPPASGYGDTGYSGELLDQSLIDCIKCRYSGSSVGRYS
jgi:hypothetical protein